MNTKKKIIALFLTAILSAGMLAGCTPAGYSPSKTDDYYYYENSGAPMASPLGGDNYNGSDYKYYYAPQYNFDNEEYAEITEQGFLSTSIRPLSTFASDVDTASYANLRRMINDGASSENIPADAVRIEEMLNYFDYDYAAPKNGELFGMTSQIADCPWNQDTKLLIMGLATKEIDYSRIAGSNLVFLIDVSGSMSSPDKLPLLKKSFKTLVDGLNENDRISIVTYAGDERLVCEGVPGSEKRELKNAIDRLSSGGSTNGQAGLELAYEIASENYIEGGNNRIILASDGDLNVGISSTDELNDYVTTQRETGVYLSVLGFGTGNYKDAKMETLADNGNGAYHYIDCIDEAEKVFGKDLAANLVTLAKDVKLQVEFNPAMVKGYRLIGYENRAMKDEDFHNAAADAGEIGWGHQITVAYELVMFDSKMEIPGSDLKYQDTPDPKNMTEEWLTCNIRYKAPDTEKGYENTYIVDKQSFTDRPHNDWHFAAAVIETGMVLRDSEYLGDASLRQAKKLLGEASLNDRYKKEFAELLNALR